MERLSKSITDVTRMRRSEHRRKEMEIERGWLELERKKQERRNQIASGSTTKAEHKEFAPPMSEEVKMALMMEILGSKGEPPREKFDQI
jgi:hypothetical protein